MWSNRRRRVDAAASSAIISIWRREAVWMLIGLLGRLNSSANRAGCQSLGRRHCMPKRRGEELNSAHREGDRSIKGMRWRKLIMSERHSLLPVKAVAYGGNVIPRTAFGW